MRADRNVFAVYSSRIGRKGLHGYSWRHTGTENGRRREDRASVGRQPAAISRKVLVAYRPSRITRHESFVVGRARRFLLLLRDENTGKGKKRERTAATFVFSPVYNQFLRKDQAKGGSPVEQRKFEISKTVRW